MLALFVLASLLFADLCLSGPMGRESPSKRDSTKYVVAHVIVGNCYPYSVTDWVSDITLANSNGIDGFALNVGSDSWEPSQVANAYQAAQQSGTGFKLFVSFDMTSLSCSSADDAALLRNYITTYATHPNQFIYNGRVFASSFSGQSCQFGQGSVQSGWESQFLQQLTGENAVYFVPSFFVAPNTFSDFQGIADGMFNWNAGWPISLTTSSVPNTSPAELGTLVPYIGATTSDEEYINALSSMGGTYMAPVSPWFFTHYSPQTYNKNFIYLSDDHLYSRRWESLIKIRDQVDFVELITWNDSGESHYIGPLTNPETMSKAWVDGFDHTGWLKMTSYYATAFKTGTYPDIKEDSIVMWSRPHPALATAPDPTGPPANYQLEQDIVWAVVFATSPASVTLSTSSTKSQTFQVAAGATKLSLAIQPGGFMKAVLKRNGKTIVDLQPSGFTFNGSPSSYNYNAFVASSQ